MIRKLKFLELLDYYGCTYEEEEVRNFGLTKKFKTICPNGSEWNPRPQDVISHKMNRCGCSLCGNKNGISAGEVITAYLFRKYNIDYVCEKTFEGFVSEKNAPYRYDFMVGDCLLEIHGRQHFEKRDKDVFRGNEKHDEIKKNYAIENGYEYIVLGVEKEWLGWLVKEELPLIANINRFLMEKELVANEIEFTREDREQCLEILKKGKLKYKVYDIWTESLIFETDLYTDLSCNLHGVQLSSASDIGEKGYKYTDESLVLNEEITSLKDIDFDSIRKEIEENAYYIYDGSFRLMKEREMTPIRKKHRYNTVRLKEKGYYKCGDFLICTFEGKEKKAGEIKMVFENKEGKYKVKRINREEISQFETLAEIEKKFGYKRLADCLAGKNGRLFPKEIEWLEINGERVHHFLESNRSYIVYKDGFIKAFDKRSELELYLGYSKEKGNVWVKEGFPTTLDENIDFLHLKGKRAERKRLKYSFVLMNGEKFETNNKSEVEKYFGVSRDWVTYYKNKNELPPTMMKKISNYVLTV